MKKTIFVLGAVIWTAAACRIPAMAVSYADLAVDGSWLETKMESLEDADYYTVELPADGELTVRMQSEMNSVFFDVLDTNLVNSYANESLWSGTTAEPVTSQTENVVLEKGTYCVKVYAPNWDRERGESGVYRLCAEFKELETSEKEPNNKAEEAMPISSGIKQAGILWKDDEYDYYQFTMTSAGEVDILVNCYMPYMDVGLRDAFQVDVFNKEGIYNGNESEPAVYNKKVELQPGIYYLFLAKTQDGLYNVTVTGEGIEDVTESVSPDDPAASEPAAEDVVTIKVTEAKQLETVDGGEVVWGSYNLKVAAVSNTGMVVGISPGTAKIVGIAADGSGKMITYTVSVTE